MKIAKELEALVVSTLARMSADQFRRTLKAALDGRRASIDQEPVKRKYKTKKKKTGAKPGPKKKKAEEV